MRKKNFSKRFVQTDPHRRRKIQTSLAGCLRNSNRSIGIGLQDVIVNSLGFAAENQPIPIDKFRVPERSLPLAGKKPRLPQLSIIAPRFIQSSFIQSSITDSSIIPARMILLDILTGHRNEKCIDIIMHRELQPRPVIHRAPLEIPIAQNKPQRPNQMQCRPRRHAGAGDVSSIRRDLRRNQRDFHPMRRKIDGRFFRHDRFNGIAALTAMPAAMCPTAGKFSRDPMSAMQYILRKGPCLQGNVTNFPCRSACAILPVSAQYAVNRPTGLSAAAVSSSTILLPTIGANFPPPLGSYPPRVP